MRPDPITGIPPRPEDSPWWPEPITGFPPGPPSLGLAPRPIGPTEGSIAAAEDRPRIRGVDLNPGEVIAHIFTPAGGLAGEMPDWGEALVLTNERLIAFCLNGSSSETYLVPTSEVKHAVVRAGARSPATLVQGAVMVVAGLLGYLVVGYWLASQLEGPTIPVLNMDLAPFIALLITLAGLGLIAQVYFTKPNGTVSFQGDGLQFSFPFRGERAGTQIYQVVNAAFAHRRRTSGGGGDVGEYVESA